MSDWASGFANGLGAGVLLGAVLLYLGYRIATRWWTKRMREEYEGWEKRYGRRQAL